MLLGPAELMHSDSMSEQYAAARGFTFLIICVCRSRQASITTELIEIISGAAALESAK